MTIQRILLTGAAALGLVGSFATAGNQDPGTRTIEIRATRLLEQPRTVDRIEIRQVLELESDDPAFGGYSGLTIADGGSPFLAVSDRGTWLRLALADDADGRIGRVASAQAAPILDPSGAAVVGRMANDAESLITIDGAFVVGFEGAHRLWRYPCAGDAIFDCKPSPMRSPRDIRKADENNGFEAVAQLADGRLMILAEELLDRRGRLRGWIAARPGARWRGITLPAEGEFRPTSLVGLENGDAVLIERKFSPEEGVRIRISRFARGDIRPGRTLQREVLAILDESLPNDNLEAAHAIVDADGRTTLYVISDDNFSERQRTLLFEIGLPRFD